MLLATSVKLKILFLFSILSFLGVKFKTFDYIKKFPKSTFSPNAGYFFLSLKSISLNLKLLKSMYKGVDKRAEDKQFFD